MPFCPCSDCLLFRANVSGCIQDQICESIICQHDPYCCSTQWDNLCITNSTQKYHQCESSNHNQQQVTNIDISIYMELIWILCIVFLIIACICCIWQYCKQQRRRQFQNLLVIAQQKRKQRSLQIQQIAEINEIHSADTQNGSELSIDNELSEGQIESYPHRQLTTPEYLTTSEYRTNYDDPKSPFTSSRRVSLTTLNMEIRSLIKRGFQNDVDTEH